MELDHLVVAGQNLSEATAHSEKALGVPLVNGGEHAYFGTHNRLLGFKQREYFEAIAVDPNAAKPDRKRWFDLDTFDGPPRLQTWVCRVDDLRTATRYLPVPVEIVELSRGDLRWRMAVPIDGALTMGGVVPMLIEWGGDLHPCDQLDIGGGCITSLTLATPKVHEALEMLGRLGLKDDRVHVHEAAEAQLQATIETKFGTRKLT